MANETAPSSGGATNNQNNLRIRTMPEDLARARMSPPASHTVSPPGVKPPQPKPSSSSPSLTPPVSLPTSPEAPIRPTPPSSQTTARPSVPLQPQQQRREPPQPQKPPLRSSPPPRVTAPPPPQSSPQFRREIPKAQPPPRQQLPGEPTGGKKALVVALVAAGVVLLGGGAWFFIFSNEPQPSPTPTPQPTETPSQTPAPASVIPVDLPGVLRVKEGETLKESLGTFASSQSSRGLLTGISLVKPDGNPFTFSELAADLSLKIPPNLQSLILPEEYVLVSTRTETGPSLGFVLTLSDAQAATTTLTQWESTLPADLAPILLSGPAKTSKFSSDTFGDIPFRFLNDITKGLAYAIHEDHLVITTSRDLFRTVIQRLNTTTSTQ